MFNCDWWQARQFFCLDWYKKVHNDKSKMKIILLVRLIAKILSTEVDEAFMYVWAIFNYPKLNLDFHSFSLF